LRYTSFIIRLWLPDDAPDPDQAGCHGLIEHIQSGTAARIGSLEEIQQFIEKYLTRPLPGKKRKEKNETL